MSSFGEWWIGSYKYTMLKTSDTEQVIRSHIHMYLKSLLNNITSLPCEWTKYGCYSSLSLQEEFKTSRK
jgi:hypothetical protein